MTTAADLKNKKIFVTGATGFVGYHVINELLNFEIEPLILTRAESSNKIPIAWRKKTKPVVGDLLEIEKLASILNQERPEIVFHFAGTTGRGSVENEKFCDRLNFTATVELLDLFERIGCEKFILLGSADEYGRQSGRQHEEMPPSPVSPYAVSKAKATRCALEKYMESKLPVTVLRPFSVYGERQPKQMFIAEAVDCALRGEVFEMTEGTQKRDLIFIADVVRAIFAAAGSEKPVGQIFNVGTGKATALRDVAQMIWRLTEADEKLLKIGARPSTVAETHDTWADVARARDVLGWSAEVSLTQGLEKYIASCRRDLGIKTA